MKKGWGTQAYTIIEVMIFLAVTGGLLIVAMTFVAGRQNRTQFGQSIRNIQSRIDDVINNVATGYYHRSADFNCDASGSGPNLTLPTGRSQGTNLGCIFLGRAIQFAVGGNGAAYNIYNLVGLRTSGGQQVQNLAQALPKAIAPPNDADTTENGTLQYGLEVVKMFYVNGGPQQPIGVVAFVPTLAAYSTNNLLSGAQNIDLRPVNTTNLDELATDSASKISTTNMPENSKNPSGGVVICFKSGGTNQYGVITIGSNGRQLSTKLDIYESLSATPGYGTGSPTC